MAPLMRALRTGAAAAALLTGAASVAFAQSASADVVARGKYLTDMGDCAACHTAEGGAKFAGGLMMNMPYAGKISTPNITPDKETGIGTYTDDEFYSVFHDGIGRAGHLYPAMPFPWYTNVSRDDVLAIKAYLMTLDPVHAPRKPSQLNFPFNIRLGMAFWDAAFLKTAPAPADDASAEVKRGAYIVNGLEHCGECHNNNKLLGNISWSDRLQGGEIDGWYAPNITSDQHYGIGRFTDDQLAQYLKTGAAPTMGSVLGPMSQTVHESLSKLSDQDIHAVVAYLKSTQPLSDYKDAKSSDFTGADPTGVQTYLSFCASCHQQNGAGIPGKVPALDGNGAIAAGGPETIIRVILGGVNAQDSYGPMAALGASMSNEQIAEVTNYIRQSWSNKAPANAEPGTVAKLRGQTQTLLAGNLGACPDLKQEDMVKVVADPGVDGLLKGTNEGNMTQNANQLIAKVKSMDPKIKQADIVNSLTIAYCPVVTADASLSSQQKIWQLDQFSESVYTQLTTKGAQ